MSNISKLKEWKAAGYRIEIVYLTLRTPQIALQRIAARVLEGGHGVPTVDVIRRFHRSMENFKREYRPLAEVWMIYDNSGGRPHLIEKAP